MLGKIIEVHPKDAFYQNSEDFIGTVWELRDSGSVRESGELAGYFAGVAVYRGEVPLEFTNDGEEVVYPHGDFSLFHAVKFEILENTGE